MISFSRIGKQYGRQILFVDASFQLNPGEKVGLVGPNGSGKTTLFRMIVGEETADEGDVSVPKKLTIGYFRQDVEEMAGRSVLDEAIAGSGRLGSLHHELEDLQHGMADQGRAADMDAILARFGEVQEEYEHLGGYALENRTREILLGLGFDDERIDGDVGALSGGWKMRVAMARVLLGEPEVLLMDEPTNHLDIESIIWLEAFLKSRPGALLMTSHDREFMNRVVGKIAEIDGGEIVAYSGNYDFYERERALREANREAAYARQQAMLAKEQRFIDRFAAHAAKAAQVQSRVKALEKIEKIELPKKRRVVKFDFRAPQRSGEQVATLDCVTKVYGRRIVHEPRAVTLPPRGFVHIDFTNYLTLAPGEDFDGHFEVYYSAPCTAEGRFAVNLHGQVLDRDDATPSQDDPALDSVLQLAHVARPVVDDQPLQGFLAHARRGRGVAESVLLQEMLPLVTPKTLFRGKGCRNCHDTGYAGRMGCHEVIAVDDGLRRLIARGADSNQMLDYVSAKGFNDLRDDALRRLTAGETTLKEVIRVTI